MHSKLLYGPGESSWRREATGSEPCQRWSGEGRCPMHKFAKVCQFEVPTEEEKSEASDHCQVAPLSPVTTIFCNISPGQ